MRNYKKIQTEKNTVTKIVCNKCKKEITIKNGIPEEEMLTVDAFTCSANSFWVNLSDKRNSLKREHNKAAFSESIIYPPFVMYIHYNMWVNQIQQKNKHTP